MCAGPVESTEGVRLRASSNCRSLNAMNREKQGLGTVRSQQMSVRECGPGDSHGRREPCSPKLLATPLSVRQRPYSKLKNSVEVPMGQAGRLLPNCC